MSKEKTGIEWGYEGETGPSSWVQKYNPDAGSKQSPIDIHTQEAVFDEKLASAPISISYDPQCFTEIKNTGHSFNVFGKPDAASHVTGGPVKQHHKFLQFHMHWGKDDHSGSEHLVDGMSYPAEIHFVNWNSETYKQPSDAVMSNNHDGLMVLGAFLKVGKHNAEFDKIVNVIPDIKTNGSSATLQEPIDHRKLLPEDLKSYWHYHGSLTTPPCTESVQWIVFKEAVEISAEQLNKLHDLYMCKESGDCSNEYRISGNFRPVCDLNDRKVYKTFN